MASPKNTDASTASLAQRLEEHMNNRLELERKLKRLKWAMFVVTFAYAAILVVHVFVLTDTGYDIHFIVWIVLLSAGLVGALELQQKLGASARQELEVLRQMVTAKGST